MIQDVEMKDKLKLLNNIKSVGLLAVATLAVGMTAVNVKDDTQTANSSACECDSNAVYNSALPASHPSNRCAQPSDNVSWINWLTGNSRSSQFHFVDLLELLHGHKTSPMDDINPASQKNRY